MASFSGLTPTVLIPAAGFGKRVGKPPAKELLPDAEGRPMIEWVLNEVMRRGWRPVVITRSDKTELLSYLRAKSGVMICEIESSKEWPETLLKSSAFWSGHNIVLLPDTRFDPASALDELAAALSSGAEIAFATFKVIPPQVFSTWGVIDASLGQLCEKPREPAQELEGRGCRAWGLFGFRKNQGSLLLTQMLESTLEHSWKPLASSCTIVDLNAFEDLSR